jgi:hypothetical protein
MLVETKHSNHHTTKDDMYVLLVQLYMYEGKSVNKSQTDIG